MNGRNSKELRFLTQYDYHRVTVQNQCLEIRRAYIILKTVAVSFPWPMAIENTNPARAPATARTTMNDGLDGCWTTQQRAP